MAHIRRRTLPSGLVRWQARTSTETEGKRNELARDFATEREARAWLRSEGAHIEQRSIRSSASTVGAYFERWLAWLGEASQLELPSTPQAPAPLHWPQAPRSPDGG
jgi:hypothetical protein